MSSSIPRQLARQACETSGPMVWTTSFQLPAVHPEQWVWALIGGWWRRRWCHAKFGPKCSERNTRKMRKKWSVKKQRQEELITMISWKGEGYRDRVTAEASISTFAVIYSQVAAFVKTRSLLESLGLGLFKNVSWSHCLGASHFIRLHPSTRSTR